MMTVSPGPYGRWSVSRQFGGSGETTHCWPTEMKRDLFKNPCNSGPGNAPAAARSARTKRAIMGMRFLRSAHADAGIAQ